MCEFTRARFDFARGAIDFNRAVLDSTRAVRRFERVVCRFERGGQRVDEFEASPLAVREQARVVAASNTSAGDEEVVARATGNAEQLRLSRRRLFVQTRRRAGERKPRVTLDALSRCEERMPFGLADCSALAR